MLKNVKELGIIVDIKELLLQTAVAVKCILVNS